MRDSIIPEVAPTPFELMTIEELQRERAYWDRYIKENGGGMSLAVARDWLAACNALLAQRLREAPAATLLAAANGRIVGPVDLSHRVPLLEADPVLKSNTR